MFLDKILEKKLKKVGKKREPRVKPCDVCEANSVKDDRLRGCYSLYSWVSWKEEDGDGNQHDYVEHEGGDHTAGCAQAAEEHVVQEAEEEEHHFIEEHGNQNKGDKGEGPGELKVLGRVDSVIPAEACEQDE